MAESHPESHPSFVRLLEMLDLERIDRDLYRAGVPADIRGDIQGTRLFGGQVAAQAMRAATLTVDDDHHPHSMHGYFMRPGKPGVPLLLHVDRLRDGRSFTTRSVVVRQEGEAIFNLSASFHVDEDGGEYAVGLPDGLADPDGDHDWVRTGLEAFTDRLPFEMLDLGPVGPDERGVYQSTRRAWMRTRGTLPDDRALQACVATFVSDMGAVYAAARAVSAEPMMVMGASLDHAIWFHRPIRMDEWFLYDLRPVSAHGARGLVLGTMTARDGTPGLSITQEALVRPLRPA